MTLTREQDFLAERCIPFYGEELTEEEKYQLWLDEGGVLWMDDEELPFE